MFVLNDLIDFSDFINELDYAIHNLDISANSYYKKWTVDVKNFNNAAPEVNINYSGYLYQKRRAKLLRQFKSIILKYVDNEFVPKKDYLTKNDLHFLVHQPEIKKIFDKYYVQII
jgi:hypothetical protein